ncbi:hypothetical protein ACQP2X_10420 [Actinoplanes sp. CA-131856]
MSGIEALAQRVTTVEDEIAGIRQDAAEVRILAAGASQDASDYQTSLGHHVQQLNALRRTQIEQSGQLRAMSTDLRHVFDEMKSLRVTQLDQQADLDKVIEAQFRQWSDIQEIKRTQLRHYADQKAKLRDLKTDVTELKTDVTELKTDVTELKTGMAKVLQLLERRGDDPAS